MGVLAIFTRRDLSPVVGRHLAGFANQAAIAIKNAQLFAEVEQLKNRLQAENVYMQEEIKLSHNFEEMVGESQNFKNALRQVEQVAPTDTTVSIRGESGTGKELVPGRCTASVFVKTGRLSKSIVRSCLMIFFFFTTEHKEPLIH